MALVKPVILQIVGYQNSGKTTVITQLIKKLAGARLKVVTIKHHGHGGKLDIPERKDSARHIQAGALAAMVEGDGDLLLQAAGASWTLAEKIQLLRFFTPDIVLIEGYKKADFPKILLLREQEDMSLVKQLDQIKAIIVWNEKLREKAAILTNVPIFLLQGETYLNWIVDFLYCQES